MSSIILQPPEGNLSLLLMKAQYHAKPQPPPASTTFASQTILITGGNAGLGLACAELLLSFSLSHLILAVRSTEKGEQAAAQLRKAYASVTIEVWPLDMNSYDSVQNLARRCEGLNRLDAAILNAGITQAEWKISPAGHEEAFQVNYLSTALLSLLLLPKLKATRSSISAPGRLLIVTSGLALTAKFANNSAVPLIPSFDDPKGWSLAAAAERYNVSKLLQLMFIFKLSSCVFPSDVIISAVDPGATSGTQLNRKSPFIVRKVIIPLLHKIMGRSVEEGASTYVDALLKGEESHGNFLRDWDVSWFHPIMYTEEGKEVMERLWEETLEELRFAGVRDILNTV